LVGRIGDDRSRAAGLNETATVGANAGCVTNACAKCISLNVSTSHMTMQRTFRRPGAAKARKPNRSCDPAFTRYDAGKRCW
jgi:hypothetical protein